jgi:mannosyltransferase
MSSIENDAESERPAAQVSRVPVVVFSLLALVFVLARLWRLTSSCLWFDEIFSVHAARHSWSGLIKFAAADIIHPPLFYGLLKIWIAIGGESLVWLRLLPFLFAVATIFPFVLICREINLKAAETSLALLLMAVSGFQIKYAQEVRMYSLLLLLSVVSIWLFLRLLKHSSSERKHLVILTAINLLLVYTHYYGWVLIATEGLVLLILRRRQIVKFILATAALLVAYVPWIYQVAVSRERGRGVAQNLGWIPRPDLRDVLEFFVVAGKPLLFSQSTADRVYDALSAWLVFLLFAIPIGLFLWQTLRKTEKREAEVALVLFVLAPIVIAFTLSWILPYPVWGTRHLIISAGPLAIIAALAILRLQAHWMRIAVSVVLACWILFASMIFLLRPAPDFTWCAWEQLVPQMPAGGPAPEIYAFEDLVAYHLWFAGSRRENKPGVTVIKAAPGLSEDPAFFLPRRFDEIKVGDVPGIKGEQIWLAFRAPRWDEARPPLNFVKALGYQRGVVLSRKAQGEQSFLVQFFKNEPVK